jgi:hypothetical protein
MKTILSKTILFVFCLVFYSCNSDELTTNGTLSGTLTDYSSGSIDSIKGYCLTELIGKATLNSGGKFSVTLSIPSGSKIGKIDSLKLSDTTAVVSNINVYTYMKGAYVGEIMKCNYTHSDTVAYKTGDAYVLFIHSDRTCRIIGSYTTVSNKTDSTTRSYDLKFNEGWNEMVCKVAKFKKDTVRTVQSISYSSIIPTDLKWRCIKNKKNSQKFKFLNK